MTRRTIPAWAALTGVVAIGLAARLAAYTGQSFSWGSDESRFIAVAQNLTNGYFPSGDTEWFGTRIGLIWPVAGVFQVVAPSDASAAVWPLVGSLFSIVVAYLLGRDLASPRVGLVAAALVALAPMEALVGSRLRPDAIVPGLVGLAVWCGLRAGRRGGTGAVTAGLVLGLAWTVRENAFVMAPIVVAAAWGLARVARRRALLHALAGAAVAPLVAAVLFAAKAGDPLRPLIGAGTDGEWRNPVAAFSADETYTAALWEGMLDAGSPLLLVAPVVILSAAIVLYRRERRALLPGVWLVWTALYLEFGTLMNLAKPARYLTLCTIPCALLVALAVDGRLAWLVPTACAALTVVALWSLPGRPLRPDDSTLVARVADRLRGLPPGPVLAESYTWWAKLTTYTARERLTVPAARDPEFATGEQALAVRRLEPLPAPADYRGGYVVTGPVHPRSGWPSNWSELRRDLAAQVPRSELRLVAQEGDARIWWWPR